MKISPLRFPLSIGIASVALCSLLRADVVINEIHYEPGSLGAAKPAWENSERGDIFAKSLLEAAGLESKDRGARKPTR